VQITAVPGSLFEGSAEASASVPPLVLPSGGQICPNSGPAPLLLYQPAGNFNGDLTAQFLFGGYRSVDKQPVAASIDLLVTGAT
jgi:hypothetical protein